MAVPTQTTLHLPILEVLAQNRETWSTGQMIDALAATLPLTQVDLQERTPTGASRVKTNFYFAASYLARAGLLDRPSKGRFRIAAEGPAFLERHDGPISTALLERMISRRQAVDATTESAYLIEPSTHACEDVTPLEKIADGYNSSRANLADELLESLKGLSPDRFERLTVALLEKMGFGRGESVGGSGDGGIDGVINQDALGLEKVYIQAKRWSAQVGEPEIRNLAGNLDARGANKGVLITTSNFSETAKLTERNISAGNKTIRLIDGRELARLMIDYSVGVITKTVYEIKELDENFFGEET